MKPLALLLLLLASFSQLFGQNQELEQLLRKYRNNPAIVHSNLVDSYPQALDIRVGETLEFGDSLYLVRHFVEEYNKIKGYRKLKPSKVMKLGGNVLTRMALNKAITIRMFESPDGYKDTLMEFDGCVYFLIHLGGYYEAEEIGRFINVENAPRKTNKPHN